MIPALAEAERSIRSAVVNNGDGRVFGVSRVPVFCKKYLSSNGLYAIINTKHVFLNFSSEFAILRSILNLSKNHQCFYDPMLKAEGS